MPKLRLLAVLLPLLFVAAAAAQDSAKKPERGGKPAVLRIELDKTTITLPCLPGRVSRSESCSDSAVIVARVVANDGTKGLELNVMVTGGRITTEKGAEFQWDLSGVHPGTYAILAAAKDAKGRWSEQVTQTIKIVECPACGYGDPCPSLSISDPEPVQAGELMEFTIKVASEPGDTITYDWAVSAGTIESGQGTPTIKVRTDESMEGQTVTATAVIGNSQPGPACQNTASASGAVIAKKPGSN